MWPESEGIIIV
ncbi:unnamed protein product [Debaryomyces tyrocola]|nr:unnamed protein product [Debaryomyces tyrocola]